GNAVAKSIFHAVLTPSGLCFDPDGNLYVCDTGNTGKELDPEIFGRPGILRIRFQHIDVYAANSDKGDVAFLSERHAPSAIFYSKADDALYWTTSDAQGAAGGAIYRMERKQFPEQSMKNNAVGDQGALLGVAITPHGTMIASRLDGDLTMISPHVLDTVPFYESASFATPGDIKIHTLQNGNNILYVPEQEPNSLEKWKQRIRVILLPLSM
ncbi:MAG TPA: hypothetical protein VH475_17615, partial [Tepidisphaeraceae bacterium]